MKLRACAIVAIATILSGCGASANINRFRAFAELGRAYQGAVVKVIDQARSSNIDADSQQLINGRDQIVGGNGDTSRLATDIEAANEEVIETERTYGRIRRQVGLLNDYFAALGTLADYDGDEAIGQSAGGIVSALQGIFAPGETVTIGSADPVQLVSGAVTLIVQNVRSRRLTEELRRNGGEIDRQLANQQLLLDAMAQDILNDQNLIIQRRLLDDVMRPFAGTAGLPASWAQRRRELLIQAANSAEPAAEAAALSRKMRKAFTDLVAGRLQAEDLVAYANDLSRLVAIAEAIDGGGN